MALKMRFLYYSGKGKMKAIAEAVKTEFELTQNHNAIDIIPPAYSCENERLVILAISGKGELDDMLRRFCSELNKKKAQNVALLIRYGAGQVHQDRRTFPLRRKAFGCRKAGRARMGA